MLRLADPSSILRVSGMLTFPLWSSSLPSRHAIVVVRGQVEIYREYIIVSS